MTDHTGPRRKRICQQCGKSLPENSRADRKYCSVRCRVAAHRERKEDVPVD